jgi:hypothetical protein
VLYSAGKKVSFLLAVNITTISALAFLWHEEQIHVYNFLRNTHRHEEIINKVLYINL